MFKKAALLLFLMSLFAIPVCAEDTGAITLDEMDTLELPASQPEVEQKPAVQIKVEAPKWEEFCESGYENAKIREKKNILNVINVVDAEQTKSNYWAERRLNFEKAIEHCNTLTAEERAFCYEGVRNAEKERNEMYEMQRKHINYKNQGIVIDKHNY